MHNCIFDWINLFEIGETERKKSRIFLPKRISCKFDCVLIENNAVNRELWSTRVMRWTWKCGITRIPTWKCLYADAWRFFRMQWLLNVHVHATFIEECAHDAAARLNSRVLPLGKEGKKKEMYREEKNPTTLSRWFIELRGTRNTA